MRETAEIQPLYAALAEGTLRIACNVPPVDWFHLGATTGDTYHYSYDPLGNRLSQESTVNGLEPALNGSEGSTVSYVYDDANRLASAGGQSYTFDANGNLLNDGLNTYAYDTANRLSAVNGSIVHAQLPL